MQIGDVNWLSEIFTERSLSSQFEELVLGFRFGVFFFAGGTIPNSLDIRFQKVSGLSLNVETHAVSEGGQNFYTHQTPKRLNHGNLILERGLLLGSPLASEFNLTMTSFQFYPANVLVTLFSEEKIPVAAWLFLKAFVVKWSTADLDAGQRAVVIDTIELAYTRVQKMRF
ncbi:MAG: phage tail protein [Anaerolineales bacterium]|nr:phage tail protein [Anaerolineales bacterium]MCB8963003.1 phage tail protein [Ardenticatenales bacterium]MCB0005155.1 phage tail protein [Anaerolineales bacterium]MCB0011970.1 phage tail protein [Anaerolineales bacterium]MCB0017662.1 phage tail protein [Anaerolineales bacterium]